jgi:predicted O-methyltransferase YrrM
MYPTYRLGIEWLNYVVRASSGRGHGIHSPFVYELVTRVLNDPNSYYAFEPIELLKTKLLRDTTAIDVLDMGAGADGSKNAGTVSANAGKTTMKRKRISGIAARSVCDRKFGRLLFRLADFTAAEVMVELGTSLGISTAYLASARPSSAVYTVEGSAAIASVARENFSSLGIRNISLLNMSFEDALKRTELQTLRPGLVYIDGNHRLEPVMEYFHFFLERVASQSAIILHDIHWSSEMKKAWTLIRQHPKVKMSIDIFSAGLVFFRDEFQVRQDFTIRF